LREPAKATLHISFREIPSF